MRETGALELLEQRPDFVLSGINAGANTGINVLYSGTVAAAIEAAFFGVPAMAVSLQLTELDFQRRPDRRACSCIWPSRRRRPGRA